MPNYITLANHEARRLAEEGTLLVVRPVVPQPPECTVDFIWNEDPDAEYPHLWLSAYETAEYPSVLNFDPWFRSPLGAPGDVLLCKETWLHTGLSYKYRVSDPQWGKTCHWRPASTMPAWAVRFRPVVREAGVMRVQDMDATAHIECGIEVQQAWCESAACIREKTREVFAAYWNRRFRRYKWESNPWCWTAWVETPEAAARDEWAQREADKRRAMLEDMWAEEQNA